jgi:chromosome segregation ATPase
MDYLTNYYKNLAESLQQQVNFLEEGLKKAMRSNNAGKMRKEMLRQAARQAPHSARASHLEDVLDEISQGEDEVGHQTGRTEQILKDISHEDSQLGHEVRDLMKERGQARHQERKHDPNIEKLATAMYGLRGTDRPASQISLSPSKGTPADRAILSAVMAAKEGENRHRYAEQKERGQRPRSPSIIGLRKDSGKM